jgi:hypothetical protein
MGFTKNNVGIFITLILVILLCVSKFFNFLTETHLGRFILLAFVVVISYTHKMLGLLAVLFIIIAFNNYDYNTVYAYNYYEGFDVSGNSVDASGNSVATSIIDDKVKILKAKEDILKTELNAIQQKSNNSSQTATTTSSAAASSTSENFRGGREGFGITDRESNMLRGKPSNSIPVFNNSREQSDDVSPSDKTVFTSDYASF